MDTMDVLVYFLAAGVGAVAAVMLATSLWRRTRRARRVLRERSASDRRQRRVPVVWERRRAPRRLEDVARGFLTRIERGRRISRTGPSRNQVSIR
jgi:hypothetical protein